MTDKDTFPQWLYVRFGEPRTITWDELSDGDQLYWEHEAAAVRRAVARNGFKNPQSAARKAQLNKQTA